MKRPDTIDSPCSFTNLQLEVRLSASPDSSENQQVCRPAVSEHRDLRGSTHEEMLPVDTCSPVHALTSASSSRIHSLML